MLVVSSREFRDNQKKYFDLVDNNNQVVVKRGKYKAYVLTPVGDTDKLSENPQLIKVVRQAESELKRGESITIKNPKNIWESIL
jgi:PHD/YefM family antitoxin component YafN of YafNO toxin-antitoxin module